MVKTCWPWSPGEPQYSWVENVYRFSVLESPRTTWEGLTGLRNYYTNGHSLLQQKDAE